MHDGGEGRRGVLIAFSWKRWRLGFRDFGVGEGVLWGKTSNDTREDHQHWQAAIFICIYWIVVGWRS